MSSMEPSEKSRKTNTEKLLMLQLELMPRKEEEPTEEDIENI
jgi:hypothetical protein